jgi:hypothetical protein
MTFDFGTWMRGSILPSARAASIWRIIQRDPKSITFYREGVFLAAQIVRIEHDNTSNVRDTPIGRVNVQGLKIYGTLDHATQPDLDAQVGDRFWLETGVDQVKSEYEVRQVMRLPGQIQALAERSE